MGSYIVDCCRGYLFYSKDKKVVNVEENPITTVCYYEEVGNEIKDVFSLKLVMQNEKVTGELKFLPAEKDKKVGPLEGLVAPFGENNSSRVIAAWWDASAEGTTVREQSSIILESDKAQIGFGEMKEIEDGSYIFVDPLTLSYSLSLSKTDCSKI